MNVWLAPVLLPAMLIMVVFALVPRRLQLVRLGAVLGWVAVWLDNRLTSQWTDVAGLAVVVACVLVWLSAAGRPAARARARENRR